MSYVSYVLCLFMIWQGGQLASPVRMTLAKVKTILGAVSTLAMLCSIIVFSHVGRGARKREIEVLALQVLNCRKREDGTPFILDYFLDFL
jgi:hypothetical protein